MPDEREKIKKKEIECNEMNNRRSVDNAQAKYERTLLTSFSVLFCIMLSCQYWKDNCSHTAMISKAKWTTQMRDQIVSDQDHFWVRLSLIKFPLAVLRPFIFTSNSCFFLRREIVYYIESPPDLFWGPPSYHLRDNFATSVQQWLDIQVVGC